MKFTLGAKIKDKIAIRTTETPSLRQYYLIKKKLNCCICKHLKGFSIKLMLLKFKKLPNLTWRDGDWIPRSLSNQYETTHPSSFPKTKNVLKLKLPCLEKNFQNGN